MELVLPPNLKEFLQLLKDKKVRYLLMGSYAVGYHGYPRATGDMDIWVAIEPDNAARLVAAMGIELLTEDQYRALQTLGDFDTKTSSWLQTPSEIRRLGGALFGDRRYGRVFVYHNSAPSYYGVRGFRGALRV